MHLLTLIFLLLLLTSSNLNVNVTAAPWNLVPAERCSQPRCLFVQKRSLDAICCLFPHSVDVLLAERASIWDTLAGNKQSDFLRVCLPVLSVFLHPCDTFSSVASDRSSRVDEVFLLVAGVCAECSLLTFYVFLRPQKHTLSFSVCPSLSSLSLAQLWFKRENRKKNTLADSAHIAKLLTGHTVCLQDTMHTRYQTAAQ